MIGQTLGHYRIEEQIGAGGMGVVYRAHDARLDRDVALKVLPHNLLDDQAASERLRREALALSRLNHPNIAHVYDFDTQSGVAFLIMEYVKGDTLARKLASGPFPEEVAVNIGVQIASALEDAAEVGVVHRDIKPSNIMLTSKGAVKVLDFGLAKLFRVDNQDLTRSHADLPDAAGTLPYMAPERLRSEPADFRSDIYSLGSVLYETVTGKRPFAGPDSISLIAEILNKKPEPPREINSTLSMGFESTVMRCLAKEPASRYQRASELRAALESVRESRSDLSHFVMPPKFAMRRALAVGALAIAAIAMAIVILRAPKVSSPATAKPVAPSELAVLPLANAGMDSETVAFGNGLVETLTTRMTQLSRNHSLQVVPASEIRAKGVTDLDRASKEFGATLGLTLNIERAGDEIRVNYSLIDAKTHHAVGGDKITAPASNPFGLEDQVADSVVNALKLELTPVEQSVLTDHGTTKPGAYDYYLQGRGYLLEFQEPKNIESAIVEFNHALEQDPNYALAYAGLGEAFWRKYKTTSNAEWVAHATSSCERAISLRSDEAAGHNCMGDVLTGKGEYENAVKEYQRAVDLEPTDDDAYLGLAVAYEKSNRMDAAENTFRKAIAMRPSYWAGYSWLGNLYLGRARYPEAETQFSEVIELAPDSYVGYGNLGSTYIDEGQYTKALPLLERSVAIEQTAANTSNLASLYYELRRFSDAARKDEEAAALNKDDFVILGNLADAYYWAPGERSKSFPVYRSAIEQAKTKLKVNPRDADTLAYLAGYEAMLGQTNAATEHIGRALALSPGKPEMLFDAAVVFNQLKADDKALDYLEQSVAAGYARDTLLDSPNLDNLHSHPRFKNLVAPAPKK